ncbi:SpaA isopeptide-forming pilin-related protein [Streptomyces fractus]|uniref:SpaA isopeptide-forming pilin-related protein n=1 Tax=Streptomyces fractus TaxID=641806 RepID=UPI003CEA0C33
MRVVHEVNANGAWDNALEPGWSDVKVTLTDDKGNQVTGATGADGTATLAPGTKLTGGRYRVQADNPDPKVYSPAFASVEGLAGAPTKLSSNEEFVDLSGGKNVQMTTGFWNPGDFCQKNALLATACHNSTVPNNRFGTDTSDRTLLTEPYNARGNDNQTTDLAREDQTGAVYGIGYSKQKRWIFSGAYAKRATAYGPGGPGGVYLTDRASGETSLFTKVPNAGSTEHAPQTNMDWGFRTAVGRESLGDVEVSEDGSELYVVNLADKKLYVYDATQKTADAPKASYAIPDPGCASAADWHPAGLGVQDGKVYVGGVCSAETSKQRADLRAVVMTFDAATGAFSAPVLNQPLTFPRGEAQSGMNVPGDWLPWRDDITFGEAIKGVPGGKSSAKPMPMLTEIVPETNGDLVLGFRDRYGDQGGLQIQWGSNPKNVMQTFATGDINRACPGAGGTFVMDANGGCKNNGQASTNGGEAANVKEYYPGEHRIKGAHQEVSMGGIALSKVESTIANTSMDANDQVGTSGTGWLDRANGTRTAQNPGNQLTSSFGKSGGMADIEVLCDLAPLQVGNRVWIDTDKDGIQDPGEDPVKGATVNLYDADDKVIATTKTSARGEYYFDSTLMKNVPAEAWKPETDYRVAVDALADYEAGGPLAGMSVTKAEAGDNELIDSNGTVPKGGKYPEYSFTTGQAGENNHSYDFGFITEKPYTATSTTTDRDTKKPIEDVPCRLWEDTNGEDGLQTSGNNPDKQVGEAQKTDAKGVCSWTELPNGDYYVDYPETPVGYQEPASKVSPKLPLDEEKREYRTANDYSKSPLFSLSSVANEEGTEKPLPDADHEVWQETNDEPGLQRDGDTPDMKVRGTCTTKAEATDGATGSTNGEPTEAGTCRWTNLLEGTYYVYESKVPAGYDVVGDNPPAPVTLNKENPTDEVVIPHKKPGAEPQFQISSRAFEEGTNKSLPGAEYQVWEDTNGEKGLQREGDNPDKQIRKACTTKESDTKGAEGTPEGEPVDAGACAWTELPAGTYYAYEAQIPEGYKLTADEVSKPVTLNTENPDERVEFPHNKPVGAPTEKFALSSVAIEEGTKKPLPGAEYRVWEETNGVKGLQSSGDKPDMKVRENCVTKESDTAGADGSPEGEPTKAGTCDWTELPGGTYYVYESQLPKGYDLTVDKTSKPVTLSADNPYEQVVFPHNKPAYTAKACAVVKGSEKPLATAKHAVWMETNGVKGLQRQGANADTKVQKTLTTRKSGCSTWNKLTEGSYYLTETMAPKDYQAPKSTVSKMFTLNPDNPTQAKVFRHCHEHDATIVTKDAKTRKPVSGAVVELWKETNDKKGLQVKGKDKDKRIETGCATNSKAECTWKGLDNGRYYFRETDVPEGYLMARKLVTMVLTCNGDHNHKLALHHDRVPPKGKKK